MSNPFDQFDAQQNPFDQFDVKPQAPVDNALESTIKHAAGGVIGDINQVIGAVNSPLKGLAGIAGLIKGAVTPGDSADNASQRFMDATGIPTIGGQGDKAIQEGIDASQATTGAILNAPVNLYRAGENKAEELANKLPWASYVNKFINEHPFLVKAQAAMKGAGDVAAQLAPGAIAAGVKVVSLAEAPPVNDSLKLANDNGVAIIPSEAQLKGANVPMGDTLEGGFGAPKTATAAAIKNTKPINSIAAKELASTAPDLGITPTTELTPEIINKARQANNAVYSEVRDLSKVQGRIPADENYAAGISEMEKANNNSFGANPDIDAVIKRIDKPSFTSDELLSEIQRLRGNARSNYKASSGAPGKNTYDLGDLADAQNAAADLLEDRLERFVKNVPGQENLASQLQQARVNLAKINAIDNSIKAGTTDVNPAYFGKQLDSGAPLTDGLKDIGTLANNFPKSVRLPTNIASKTGLSRLDMMGALYSLSKILTNPGEAAVGTGAFLGGPLVRHGLLSDAYQNSMFPKTSNIKPLAPYAAGQSLMTGNDYQSELYKQLIGQQ